MWSGAATASVAESLNLAAPAPAPARSCSPGSSGQAREKYKNQGEIKIIRKFPQPLSADCRLCIIRWFGSVGVTATRPRAATVREWWHLPSRGQLLVGTVGRAVSTPPNLAAGRGNRGQGTRARKTLVVGPGHGGLGECRCPHTEGYRTEGEDRRNRTVCHSGPIHPPTRSPAAMEGFTPFSILLAAWGKFSHPPSVGNNYTALEPIWLLNKSNSLW